MITVYVVDNNREIQSVVDGRSDAYTILENEIQALNVAGTVASAIVMVHYELRGHDTGEFIKLLRAENPLFDVIVMGHDLQDEEIIKCILAGAKGYQAIDTLHKCSEKLVAVVADGEAWISRKMVSRLIDYAGLNNLHPA